MLLLRLKKKLPLIVILLFSPLILVFNLLLILIMCLDPRARKFDKEEARLLLADGVTPLLWTVYGFRIKPHLSASIRS